MAQDLEVGIVSILTGNCQFHLRCEEVCKRLSGLRVGDLWATSLFSLVLTLSEVSPNCVVLY